jgi:hypothetical protein
MHSDLQPEVGGSGAYALIMHLGERVGMPVAEGGSGAVSAALAEDIRHAGGVNTTGRRVDRIVVEGGWAVGIEAGVDAFGARRAVIAALDLQLVIRLAGPDAFPSRSLPQLPRYRRGLGTFKLDWALDGPVPWLAEACRRGPCRRFGPGDKQGRLGGVLRAAARSANAHLEPAVAGRPEPGLGRPAHPVGLHPCPDPAGWRRPAARRRTDWTAPVTRSRTGWRRASRLMPLASAS